MASGTHLRHYTETDLDALIALDDLCFAPPFRFSRATMRGLVRRRNSITLLAVTPGESGPEAVQGFCIVTLEGRNPVTAYVATIDVAPPHRGKGIATRLLLAAEADATKAGATCIQLHVFVQNAGAIRLYERLSYECVARVPSFYGPGLHAWVYSKDLL